MCERTSYRNFGHIVTESPITDMLCICVCVGASGENPAIIVWEIRPDPEKKRWVKLLVAVHVGVCCLNKWNFIKI